MFLADAQDALAPSRAFVEEPLPADLNEHVLAPDDSNECAREIQKFMADNSIAPFSARMLRGDLGSAARRTYAILPAELSRVLTRTCLTIGTARMRKPHGLASLQSRSNNAGADSVVASMQERSVWRYRRRGPMQSTSSSLQITIHREEWSSLAVSDWSPTSFAESRHLTDTVSQSRQPPNPSLQPTCYGLRPSHAADWDVRPLQQPQQQKGIYEIHAHLVRTPARFTDGIRERPEADSGRYSRSGRRPPISRLGCS